MESEYRRFLEQPTSERYLAVQRLVFSGGVDDSRLRELIRQIELQRLNVSLDMQDQMGATWLLSPSFHFWSARLGEMAGDADAVELERFQFQACRTGLMSTGDGSHDSPFRVTYTSDVQDILVFLGLDSVVQRVLQHSHGIADAVRCSNGEQLYFVRPELTEIHEKTLHRTDASVDGPAREAAGVSNAKPSAVPGSLL